MILLFWLKRENDFTILVGREYDFAILVKPACFDATIQGADFFTV